MHPAFIITAHESPTPPEPVAAARSLVATLETAHQPQAAVTLVHAGAVVQHAAAVGLIDEPATVRAGLEQIATLHPALAGFADVAPKSSSDDKAIAELWRRHELMDPAASPVWYSHPLGDLYQALSVEARKGRALCQTPWWVTDLLIKLSYEHAVRDWVTPTVMDPACGTGHILVEALQRANGGHRIARHTFKHSTPEEALDRIHGVDLDPYAVLLTRWRLLVMTWAQLRHRGTCADLRGLPLHVAQADALLSTDEPLLQSTYHVVLANPPYITSKDATATTAIRERYRDVCSGRFSLALPFHVLMMRLLVPGGWCAQLTANSFMKREFGRRYIEKWLPQSDMRWLIDTSGAYIPGHGTPTVILVHRNQEPTDAVVHRLVGERGEPGVPPVPANGKVWTAITEAVKAVEFKDKMRRLIAEHQSSVVSR